jgi:hypothetical protein
MTVTQICQFRFLDCPPSDIVMRHLVEMTKMQLWTLKPAFRNDKHKTR